MVVQTEDSSLEVGDQCICPRVQRVEKSMDLGHSNATMGFCKRSESCGNRNSVGEAHRASVIV
jgi:hypothetical protein